MRGEQERFVYLDGLRGLAALVITLCHFYTLTLGEPPLARVYLAVDFFFVLSGFVCCYAYERRLLADMSWLDFVKRRIIRLYPLYFLGFLFGLAVTIELCRREQTPLSRLIGPAFSHLLMVPLPEKAPIGALSATTAVSGEAFPLNLPVWALAYEVFISFLWAGLVKRLNLPVLIAVIAGFFAIFSAGAWLEGTYATGSQVAHILPAFCRTGFSFFMGVLVFRLWRPGTASPWLWLPLTAGFYGLLSVPHLSGGNRILDAGLLLLGLPAVVFLAARTEVPARFAKACRVSGAFAYPIYMLHYPLIALAAMKVNAYHLTGWAAFGVFAQAFTLAIILSGLAIYWFDNPVRRLLGQALLPKRSKPPQGDGATA
jgi:peptidoglycan/LPS O-acetylase OafA/YrhL